MPLVKAADVSPAGPSAMKKNVCYCLGVHVCEMVMLAGAFLTYRRTVGAIRYRRAVDCKSRMKAKMDKRLGRVQHVTAHADSLSKLLPLMLENIRTGQNIRPTYGQLNSYAITRAVLSWFADGDAAALRSWAKCAARMELRVTLCEKYYQPYGLFSALVWPLLANDVELVNSYIELSASAYEEKRRTNPRTDEYLLAQVGHAFAGNWATLAENCREWLLQQKIPKSQELNVLDYKFLAALAQQSEGDMAEVLQAMVSPAELRRHRNIESGYTADLMSSKGVIYAKLAWYHGIKVDIGSDFIPSSLLSWDVPSSTSICDELLRSTKA